MFPILLVTQQKALSDDNGLAGNVFISDALRCLAHCFLDGLFLTMVGYINYGKEQFNFGYFTKIVYRLCD